MYYAHFGLNEAPFRITPNTEVFFGGANRGAILDALIYAISQGEGIVKVTGEVGTGKTMLCNMLQSRLPPEVETVYLAHPSVSPEEILHAIAFELQLKVERNATRMEVMQALYSYLLERHAQKKQVVIFIEESQNMPIATLEEVRLLSNLETGKHKLLQIVLFGQPELDDNLRQPNIRQLRERITHSFTLPPLAPAEVGEYLMFRMRAVGYRGPDLFSAGVIKRIAQASAGLTRRVNLIADKALLAAFSENTHTIQHKHVAAAIRDSEFARDGVASRAGSKGWWLAALAAMLVLLAAGGYVWTQQMQGTRPAAVRPAGAATPAHDATAEVAASPARPDDATRAPLEAASATPPNAAGPADAAIQVASLSAAPSGVIDRPAEDARVAIVARPQQPPSQAPAAGLAEALPPAEQAASDQEDMLQSRIDATLRWLNTEAPATHAVQLLGSENSEQLRQHLSTISKSLEIERIFVYRTLANQKPFLTVLYGSFGSREAAQGALDRLPPPLKAFRPYLRTVQGIREEMSRNKTL